MPAHVRTACAAAARRVRGDAPMSTNAVPTVERRVVTTCARGSAWQQLHYNININNVHVAGDWTRCAVIIINYTYRSLLIIN